jgi:hypothetical protein
MWVNMFSLLWILDYYLLLKPQASLGSFIHFPLPDSPPSPSPSSSFTTFCDANWGPQDASHPSPTNNPSVTIQESVHCGHIFFYGGCPILWKTHKYN